MTDKSGFRNCSDGYLNGFGGYVDRNGGCRIQELEVAVERMRQQQDQLQRRLKEEQDRKTKLEVNPPSSQNFFFS